MPALHFKTDRSAACIDIAARIWAEATAARDGDLDPGPLCLARRKISVGLNKAHAVLLTAWDSGEEPVGFAVITPSTDRRAEVTYLGVSPPAWNQGIGSQLLSELAEVLRSRDYVYIELWVYADNPPAVALYERLHWRADGQTRLHPRSRRTEVHYALQLDSFGTI